MPSLPAPTPAPLRTRVLLADQPSFSRTAVAHLLAETPGVELMRVVADEPALRWALARLRPDVLVIDDRLLNHAEWLGQQKSLSVIVIGVDDVPSYAVRAKRLGAVAWLAKERGDLLVAALSAGRAHHEEPQRSAAA
jgi:DNA-binding NarL/FixJ family response regulator